MKIAAILFTVALLPAGAHAQQTPTFAPVPPVTPAPTQAEFSLQELIDSARSNSARLSIARANAEAARQRANASRAFSNPTLQFVPGFTGNREARDEEIILAQPLDVFGLRRARATGAIAEFRRAEAELKLAERTVIVETTSAANALFAAQEAVRLEEVQVEIARQFRTAAARRAELGDVPPVHVQRAELELLRAENDLSTANAEHDTRQISVRLLTGSEPEVPIRVQSPLDGAATTLLRATPVQATALAPAAPLVTSPFPLASERTEAVTGTEFTRPDLLGAQALLDARRAQVSATRRVGLPTVELQARRAPFLGRDGSVALRAVVTLPLFDFGSNRGERRAAQEELRAQEASVTWLQRQITAQVATAKTRLARAQENVRRHQTQIVPLALDLLRKAQIGYDQGATTYLEVLDAQRTLRQVRTEYLHAIVSLQSASIALEAAQFGGQPDTDFNFTNLPIASAARGTTR